MSEALKSLTPKALFDEWLAKATTREIDAWVDKGFRHKGGSTLHDAFTHWLSVSRHFGYATHDDSFGEFEKEFSIIVQRMVMAERHLEALRATPTMAEQMAERCEFCGIERPIRADILVCAEQTCWVKKQRVNINHAQGGEAAQ